MIPLKPCVEVILIYWSQTNMVIVALTNVIYKCIFVSLGHATWEIVSKARFIWSAKDIGVPLP